MSTAPVAYGADCLLTGAVIRRCRGEDGLRTRRVICDDPFVTWQKFVLSMVVFEAFLIGTQWLFLHDVSGPTTVAFSAFFVVMMKPWKLSLPRPHGSGS